MICFTCGHKREEHSVAHHDPTTVWCSECYRFGVNKRKNSFFKHPYVGNLEYLEKKSLEKKNVA
jgi:hypothetical protein